MCFPWFSIIFKHFQWLSDGFRIQDDIGISTLLGEYSEKGSNHGFPTYQKALKKLRRALRLQVPENSDEVNVFVYFWDDRAARLPFSFLYKIYIYMSYIQVHIQSSHIRSYTKLYHIASLL